MEAQLGYYHLNGRTRARGARVRTLEDSWNKHWLGVEGREASIHVSMDYTAFTQA